jgi:hypothetical protein
MSTSTTFDMNHIQQEHHLALQAANPIYDYIDAGDFDGAIRMGERPTSMHHAIVNALTGYCYAAKKNKEKAMFYTRMAMQKLPIDEPSLNAIAHTSKMCHMDEELATFYNNLLARYPNQTYFLNLLFNINCRLNDSKQMQLTAMKLYKATNNNRYHFWAVASMLQQSELPAMMLTVAEKMITKALYPPEAETGTKSAVDQKECKKEDSKSCETGCCDADDGVKQDNTLHQPGAEMIELYVEVLKRQGSLEDALKCLCELYTRPVQVKIKEQKDFEETPELVKMTNLRYQTIKIELMKNAVANGTSNRESLIQDVLEESRKVLQDYPDQWSAHEECAYILSTGSLLPQKHGITGAALGNTKDVGSNDPVEINVSQVLEHRLYLHSLQEEHSYLRGPFLAEIFLLSIAFRSSSPTALVLMDGWVKTSSPADFESAASPCMMTEFITLLSKYLDKFQSKQCCFSDIKPYLETLICDNKQHATSETINDNLEALDTWISLRMSQIKSEVRSIIEERNNKTVDDEIRNCCVRLLCGYSKFGQVKILINHLRQISFGLESIADNTQILQNDREMIEIHLVSKEICAESIGGEREVQPGDELLLLRSNMHRCLLNGNQSTLVSIQGQTPISGSIDCDQLYRYLIHHIQWAELIRAGITTSPYSYTMKLELMDIYRKLNLASSAKTLFEGLGSRHVQSDTMTFLLMPSLLEGGLFMDARKQNMTVLSFHRGAAKDTGDMIGTSFQYGNYSSGLEMKRFLNMCQNSIQLILSRLECPLLDIMETSCVSPEIALKRLSDVIDPSSTSHVPYLESADIDKLSNNCDFNLCLQYDISSKERKDENELRSRQIKSRITEAQSVIRMLHILLQKDATQIDSQFQGFYENLTSILSTRFGSCWAVLNGIMMSNGSEEDVDSEKDKTMDSLSQQSSEGIITTEEESMMFSQSIQAGGSVFESVAWFTSALFMNIAKQIQSSSDDSNMGKIKTLCFQASVSLRLLDSMLFVEKNGHLTSVYLPITANTAASTDASSSLVMNPTWIHRAAFLSRTLITWAPILLNNLKDANMTPDIQEVVNKLSLSFRNIVCKSLFIIARLTFNTKNHFN